MNDKIKTILSYIGMWTAISTGVGFVLTGIGYGVIEGGHDGAFPLIFGAILIGIGGGIAHYNEEN